MKRTDEASQGGTCRHEPSDASHWDPVRGVNVWTRRCWNCSALLSLGPSYDEPDCVKVEMRALVVVELARTNDGAEHMTELEKCGYSAYVFDDGWRGAVVFGDEEFEAGYLAAAIAAHDEDDKGAET